MCWMFLLPRKEKKFPQISPHMKNSVSVNVYINLQTDGKWYERS